MTWVENIVIIVPPEESFKLCQKHSGAARTVTQSQTLARLEDGTVY